MVESSIDGFRVDYLSAGDELPAGSTEALRGYQARFDGAAFDHPRVRRALISFPMRDTTWTFFGVVHWDDGRDLDALDAVARRAEGPEDEQLRRALEAGLFCPFATAQCRACAGTSIVAVADGGFPVVTIERRLAHAAEGTCPTCGDERFVRYVELFVGG